MAQYHTRFFDADNTIVEVKKPSESAWTFLPGVQDFTTSGGEPPSNDVGDFQGTSRAFGTATPEGVTMTIPAIQVAHVSYAKLREALRGNAFLQFRWRNPEEIPLADETASNNTVAIAATSGAITKAGTAHPSLTDTPGVGPGAAIKIGTDYYYFDKIASDGDIGSADTTISNPPASAVAASVYSLVMPPIYQPAFVARVLSLNVSSTSAGSLTGSLSLGLTTQLPDIKPGTP